jgi:hypothetical protein
LFNFKISFTAIFTSDSDEAPVANIIGFFFLEIFLIISCQVMSPDPILKAGINLSVEST